MVFLEILPNILCEKRSNHYVDILATNSMKCLKFSLQKGQQGRWWIRPRQRCRCSRSLNRAKSCTASVIKTTTSVSRRQPTPHLISCVGPDVSGNYDPNQQCKVKRLSVCVNVGTECTPSCVCHEEVCSPRFAALPPGQVTSVEWKKATDRTWNNWLSGQTSEHGLALLTLLERVRKCG